MSTEAPLVPCTTLVIRDAFVHAFDTGVKDQAGGKPPKTGRQIVDLFAYPYAFSEDCLRALEAAYAVGRRHYWSQATQEL